MRAHKAPALQRTSPRPRRCDIHDHDDDDDFHDTRCLDELDYDDHLQRVQHVHELEHIDEPCDNYIDDFDSNRFSTERLELSNRHAQLLVPLFLAAQAPA